MSLQWLRHDDNHLCENFSGCFMAVEFINFLLFTYACSLEIFLPGKMFSLFFVI